MKHLEHIKLVKDLEAPAPTEFTAEQLALVFTLLKVAESFGEMVSALKANIYYQRPLDWQAVVKHSMVAEAYLADCHSILMGTKKVPNSRELSLEQSRLLHAVLGMVSESCELSTPVADNLFFSKVLDLTNFVEELGDILFYKRLGLDVINSDLTEVEAANIRKLRKRYASGKFSRVEANNRDLAAERKELANEQQ